MPTVVGLYRANHDLGLEVISFTGSWGDDDDAKLLSEAKKLGIEHPIGMVDYHGTWSPYLDVNRHALTHVYVITRSGGILWAEDPSSKLEDFLEAVDRALDAPAVGPLPEALHPELAEAVESYVSGDLEKASKRATPIRDKHSRRSSDESVTIAADAGVLLGLIEGTLRATADASSAAQAAWDLEGLLRADRALAFSFPKSSEAREAHLRLEAVREDPAQAPVMQQWEEWLDLQAERPPLFPAVAGSQEKKFARTVERFVESRSEDAPGVGLARRWLERFAAAPADR